MRAVPSREGAGSRSRLETAFALIASNCLGDGPLVEQSLGLGDFVGGTSRRSRSAAVRQPPASALGAGRDHHDARLAPRPRVQGESVLKLATCENSDTGRVHHAFGLDPREQPDQADDGRRIVARPEHRHRRRPTTPATPPAPHPSARPAAAVGCAAPPKSCVAGAATALIARGRQQPVRHGPDFRTPDTHRLSPGGFRRGARGEGGRPHIDSCQDTRFARGKQKRTPSPQRHGCRSVTG